MDLRAARARRRAAALRDADGAGRARGRVSEPTSARRRCCSRTRTARSRPPRRSRRTCGCPSPASSRACASRSASATRGTSYVEAVYVLPLPDDAAVDRLSMKIGERVIEGEIHERQAAERIYGEARAAGQRASLVRQTSANLFTTAVANIAPGEHIDITIEYLQTARYDAGEFSLRVPMTFTPRYGAPDTPEGQSALASAVLPEPLPTIAGNGGRRAQHPAARSLRPRGARARHAARMARQPHATSSAPFASKGPAWSDGARRLRRPRTAPRQNGVFVHPPPADLLRARHRGAARADGPRPRDRVAAAGRRRSGDRGAHGDRRRHDVCAADDPAAGAAHYERRAAARADLRHRQLGLDGRAVDGAGQGRAEGCARPARAAAIASTSSTSTRRRRACTPAPRGSPPRPMRRRCVRRRPRRRRRHRDRPRDRGRARATRDRGLPAAGHLHHRRRRRRGDERVRRDPAHRCGDARLFTIGIGSAPNSYFMRKAAQFGRGTYTHIGDIGDVSEKMTELFAKLERVAL